MVFVEDYKMTNIRCGKLLPTLEEDENLIQEASKSHDSLGISLMFFGGADVK